MRETHYSFYYYLVLVIETSTDRVMNQIRIVKTYQLLSIRSEVSSLTTVLQRINVQRLLV
nr:MAG TPA: hypothetical protein [Caudoviricetes sp.]